MIKSITPREQFEESFCTGSLGERTFGYSLPNVPVGEKIFTGSQIVFVVGPNGSGKSTLVAKLAHQLRFSGEGINFYDIDPPQKPNVIEGFFSDEGEVKAKLQANRRGELERWQDYRADLRNRENPYLSGSKLWGKEWDEDIYQRSSGEIRLEYLERILNGAEKTEGVICLDEPENSLDSQNVDRLTNIITKHLGKNQLFCATHSRKLIEHSPEDSVVIDLSGEKPVTLPKDQYLERTEQKLIPISKASYEVPIRYLTIVKEEEAFLPEEFRTSDRKEEYSPPTLPLGLEMNVNSPLVLVIGPNGSGKSTLLNKIQERIPRCIDKTLRINDEEKLDLFFHSIYSPDAEKVDAIRNTEERGLESELDFALKNNMSVMNRDLAIDTSYMRKRLGEIAEESRRRAKNSQGQHRLESFENELRTFKERSQKKYNKNRPAVLFIDEPESSFDARNRVEMAEKIINFSYDNQIQTFIATHDPSYLSLSPVGTTVIDMNHVPARVFNLGENREEIVRNLFPESKFQSKDRVTKMTQKNKIKNQTQQDEQLSCDFGIKFKGGEKDG